jgi:NADP-dependent 3-hydroxy acid dehydrogenase YdfG
MNKLLGRILDAPRDSFAGHQITGGNSGIGLATARRFVAEGARVAITGRDAATLAAAANELGVTAIKSDVLDTKARSNADIGLRTTKTKSQPKW